MNIGDWWHFLELKMGILIAAAGGSVIRALVLREPFPRALTAVVVGFLCSILFTDAIVDFFSLNPNQSKAVSAALSMGGLTICEGMLKYLNQWRKNPWLPYTEKSQTRRSNDWEGME